MITRAIKYLSFVPWILYFIEIMLYRIGVVENYNLDKNKYLGHLKRNKSTTFNIKEIFLFIVFLFFKKYDNTPVLETLFSTIYICMLIDFFQELANDCKKIKNKSLMVQSVILVVSIVVLFMVTNKLYTTYILMFIASILSAYIMYIFAVFTKILKEPKKK